MANSKDSGVGAGKPADHADDQKRAKAGDPPQDDFLQEKREALDEQGLSHASMNAGQPMERKEYSKTEREGDQVTRPEDNVAPAVADSPAEQAKENAGDAKREVREKARERDNDE